MVLSLCADILRLHLNVAHFYPAPLSIEMNQFWGTSTSIACISSVQANRGISTCLHWRRSKRAIPSEHRIWVHTAGMHAKTHTRACTHTHIQAHAQTGAYSGHEGKGRVLFSHSISIYVNSILVIVQKQPVVWWSDELSWLQGGGQTGLENTADCAFSLFFVSRWFCSKTHTHTHTQTENTYTQLISRHCPC